jgi:hypothetical protein
MEPTIRQWHEHLSAIAEGSGETIDGSNLYEITKQVAEVMHAEGIPYGSALDLARAMLMAAEIESAGDMMRPGAPTRALDVLSGFLIGFRLGINPRPFIAPDFLPEETP